VTFVAISRAALCAQGTARLSRQWSVMMMMPTFFLFRGT
jgi:hypothetical protein